MATLSTSWLQLDSAYLGNSYGNLYINLYARYTKQSTTDNNSYVEYQTRLSFTGNYIISQTPTYCTLKGTGISDKTTQYTGFSGSTDGYFYNGETVLQTSGAWVDHNDSGNASISASAYFNAGPWGWSATAEGSADLPTIPRATPAPKFTATIGTPMYITISPKATDTFYHRIHLTVGGTGYWLKSDGSITTSSSGYSTFGTSATSMKFNAPTSLYSEFTGKSTTGTIKVYTYKRTWNILTQQYKYTQVGSTTSESFTLNCNASKCTPVITGTVVDTNSTTLALTGNENNIVANASYATITPTIKSISDTADTATTISYMYLDSVQFSGDTVTVAKPTKKSFVLRVVNSRGYPAEYTVTASGELIPYTPLTFNILSLKRPEPTTGEVAINYDGKYFNGSFTDDNTTTRYLKVGDIIDSTTVNNYTISLPDDIYSKLVNDEILFTTDKYTCIAQVVYTETSLITMTAYTVSLVSLSDETDTHKLYYYYVQHNTDNGDTPTLSTNNTTFDSMDVGTIDYINPTSQIYKYFKTTVTEPLNNELTLGWVYREANTTEWLNTVELATDVDYSGQILTSTIPDDFGPAFIETWDGENTVYKMAYNDTYSLQTVVSSSGSYVWVMLRSDGVSETIYRYTTTSGVQENNATITLPSDLGVFTTIDTANSLYQYLKVGGTSYLTNYEIKDNNTYTGNESLGTMFDYTKAYEFVFYASDLLTKLEYGKTISRGLPVFWWDANNLYVNGKIHADNVRTTASYRLSTETISSGSILNVGDLIYNDTNGIIETEIVDGSYCLKINRDGYIKISYNAWFNGTTSGRPWLQCYRCRATEDDTIEWLEVITASISDSTATFVTLSAADVICAVNANDLITLYMTTQNGDISINSGAGSYPPSYITIELL